MVKKKSRRKLFWNIWIWIDMVRYCAQTSKDSSEPHMWTDVLFLLESETKLKWTTIMSMSPNATVPQSADPQSLFVGTSQSFVVGFYEPERWAKRTNETKSNLVRKVSVLRLIRRGAATPSCEFQLIPDKKTERLFYSTFSFFLVITCNYIVSELDYLLSSSVMFCVCFRQIWKVGNVKSHAF